MEANKEKELDVMDVTKKSDEMTPDEIKKEILSWIKLFGTVLVIALVLTKVVFINARVPSSSMENTVMTGDRLIGYRFAYWKADPQRGDIILFKYPVDKTKIYIKRVIGLPGDSVDIVSGNVYINGSSEPLDEWYLAEEWIVENDGLHYDVPENCYFVMGDNRNHSQDSRYWGAIAYSAGLANTTEDALQYSFVNIKDIKGKAGFTYFKKFKKLI